MSGPATRTRAIELRRRLLTARRGKALLDEKREALLREVLRRKPEVLEARRKVTLALAAAAGRLFAAQAELGGEGVDRAALAQPEVFGVELSASRVAGLSLPSLRARSLPFALAYGPGGTCEALDAAALAYAGLVPALVELAGAELALRDLTTALARTSRRVNALERILVPDIARDLRATESSLEEEERDEALRRRSRAGR